MTDDQAMVLMFAGFFIVTILLCYYLYKAMLMACNHMYSKVAQPVLEHRAKQDAIYNSLPPLGQVRVDLMRAKQKTVFNAGLVLFFCVLFTFWNPMLWWIPAIALYRFGYFWLREDYAEIKEIEARRDKMSRS